MGLETGSYISALNSANPVGATDPKSEGDDHLRFIKAKILETFVNIDNVINASEDELNLLVGYVGALVTRAELDAKASLTGANFTGAISVPDTPSSGTDVGNKNYVDGVAALKANLTGANFTGHITVPNTPTSGTQVGNKNYVDAADALKAPLADPTFTGELETDDLYVSGLPTSQNDNFTAASSAVTITNDKPQAYIDLDAETTCTVTLTDLAANRSAVCKYYFWSNSVATTMTWASSGGSGIFWKNGVVLSYASPNTRYIVDAFWDGSVWLLEANVYYTGSTDLNKDALVLITADTDLNGESSLAFNANWDDYSAYKFVFQGVKAATTVNINIGSDEVNSGSIFSTSSVPGTGIGELVYDTVNDDAIWWSRIMQNASNDTPSLESYGERSIADSTSVTLAPTSGTFSGGKVWVYGYRR